jgi:uncharacterized repeat protein (TIGR01451 family)
MKPIAKLFLACAAAAALTVPAVPLAAQGTPSAVVFDSGIKAEKTVTDAGGKSRVEMVDPELIVPGDRLVLYTDYINTGSDPATNIVLNNPLPGQVRLAPDADPALDVSVDGGKSWGRLAALTITDSDGTKRPATQSDVTHVRWVLASIAPGEKGRLSYPAIIR